MRGRDLPRRRTLRLQPLPEGAIAWTEEQTRKNFEAVKAMVVPGSPGARKLLRIRRARCGRRCLRRRAALDDEERSVGRCSRRG
jgi:hypothetical protein